MEIRDVPHIWAQEKKKKGPKTSANPRMDRLLKIEPPHPLFFNLEITAIMTQNHMTGG